MVCFGASLEERKAEYAKTLDKEAWLDYDLLKRMAMEDGDAFFTQWDYELLKVRDYVADRLSGRTMCAMPCVGFQFSVASQSSVGADVVNALVKCVEVNREGFRKIAKKYAKKCANESDGQPAVQIEKTRLQTFDMMMAQNIITLEQMVRASGFDHKTRRIQCAALMVIVAAVALVLVVMKASMIQIVFVFGLVGGFMTAWANAANDICNSVGTAVGGGALTMAQAVFFGALFEVIGCLTLGPFVSKSIVKGIIDTNDYVHQPGIYAFGMACVLFGTSVTTLLATVYGYPISATHGIIGGLIAIGMAANGASSVGWTRVGITACGWVAAPLAGGLVSMTVFALVHFLIRTNKSPAARSRKVQPFFIWLTFTVNIAFVLIKGPKACRVKPEWLAVCIAAGAGLVLIPVFKAFVYMAQPKSKEATPEASVEEGKAGCGAGVVASNLAKSASKKLGLDESDSDNEKAPAATFDFQPTISSRKEEKKELKPAPVKVEDSPEMLEAEKYFTPLLILSALSVACAHGGNDVGNAVGPLSAIIMVAETGTVSSNPDIPFWAICYGSAGFVLGIVTMGRLTIKTVGTKLTVLTPSKSFATQMGGAVAVLGSSALGLPVSTSHCLVGSVVGIGLFEQVMKTGELNLAVLSKIALAWSMTIPLAMLLSTLAFVPFMSFFQ